MKKYRLFLVQIAKMNNLLGTEGVVFYPEEPIKMY